ncbi:MAG: amidase domain-containing protein [Oscillospiraceae bacterium]|nr:amidase domain-containing protein [Oscillospiraceae bacterium]
MLINIPYNRPAVLDYAKSWALGRNPKYYDFDAIGGDCTNFVSQCLYAGCKVMNYTPTFGWYYIDLNSRTASWSGVPYIYNFLINNNGAGPFAVLSDENTIVPGDIIQLGDENGNFYHSLVVTEINDGMIFVSAHTYDAYMKPLSEYYYSKIRFLHIAGIRKYS